eukprot:763906-Hanusia_phi.AAC.3
MGGRVRTRRTGQDRRKREESRTGKRQALTVNRPHPLLRHATDPIARLLHRPDPLPRQTRVLLHVLGVREERGGELLLLPR